MIYLAIALCCVVLFLSILDFLAFEDIHDEYASREVLEAQNVTLTDQLLERTSQKLEWKMAQISWVLRSILMIICVVLLTKSAGKFAAKPE